MGPSHGVFQELLEAETPSLHTELCGHSHTEGMGGAGQEHKECAGGREAGEQGPLPTLGSPGCIQGPVGVIVCDPGVAGQAP